MMIVNTIFIDKECQIYMFKIIYYLRTINIIINFIEIHIKNCKLKKL